MIVGTFLYNELDRIDLILYFKPHYCRGFHWLEQEEPIGIVLIVAQGWYIIHDYQIQKLQMNIGYWYILVLTVQKILKNQNYFQ